VTDGGEKQASIETQLSCAPKPALTLPPNTRKKPIAFPFQIG
jgi:hypothetical protein